MQIVWCPKISTKDSDLMRDCLHGWEVLQDRILELGLIVDRVWFWLSRVSISKTEQKETLKKVGLSKVFSKEILNVERLEKKWRSLLWNKAFSTWKETLNQITEGLEHSILKIWMFSWRSREPQKIWGLYLDNKRMKVTWKLYERKVPVCDET